MSTRFRLGTNPWRLRLARPGLRWLLGLGLFLGLQASRSAAFYLPGLAPVNFCEASRETATCKSTVALFVNRLDSVESVLPYEYNTFSSSFDFCKDSEKRNPSENLGQVLFGERISSSPYKFPFNRTGTCIKVCVKSYDTANDDQEKKLAFLRKGIRLNYQHHWIIDNMPVIWCHNTGDGTKYCTPGFPIGCFIAKSGESKHACLIHPEFNKSHIYFLFNHVDITIAYHEDSGRNGGFARLVSARLEPQSHKHSGEGRLACNGPPMEIPEEHTEKFNVTYTYSVQFEENKSIKWASRWDYILDSMSHTNIQWLSIMNSFVIILFLSGMVAIIILRTLHRDIIRYNEMSSSEDAQEDFGWKLLHGDVFRPPRNRMLLSVFLGQGTQVLIMTFITLLLACLGFLSPSNRGALMTCAVVLWVLLGTPAGYVSARMYKTLKGVKWKTNFLLTPLLCPGVVFADLFFMNVILWVEGSSAAISFGTLIGILAMWCGISVPLTFVGAYFGAKKKFRFPVCTNQIPRHIPRQSFFTKPPFGIMIGGILPFGCVFIQLFLILNSIWSHQMYFMFGFLFLVFIILLITCSEAAVLLCYFYLCAEDYHWWWRAFFTSSFTAVYLLIYTVHYFFAKLQITGTASAILYFGYTMVMVLIFFLFTGLQQPIGGLCSLRGKGLSSRILHSIRSTRGRQAYQCQECRGELPAGTSAEMINSH
ncbi:transmembrane 9 superfamily member 2-like isoform X4 [Panthera tigris]|uniref:transmembrane 9 superfamily member 2-like isoform X4 n=1 Tax=Panthera tigris TaxID=9694 RepID=UPI001C6F6363|nr:transmembrane 9 superfamily member 2-like isoform X4 [Panthera tigris]